MNDQNTTEQRRRQRADLVNAFSRRAWQPSERPQLGPRLIAGGAALILVAGGAFAVGALTSYDHRTAAEQRARMAAMSRTATPGPVVQTPLLTQSPKPKRSGSAPVGAPAVRHKGSGTKVTTHSRRLPNGSRFTSVSHVLIRNAMTGMCVDLPGYGYGQPDGGVEQYPCNGTSGDNQRWNLVVGKKGGGPHGADLFTVRNSKDGLCLDLPGRGVVGQSDVTEYSCSPGSQDNQMWYLDKKASGRFWIRAYYSEGHLCLDASGQAGSGGPDANITVFPCSLQDDHLWSFS